MPRLLSPLLIVLALVAAACSGASSGSSPAPVVTAAPTATPVPSTPEAVADAFLLAWADHDWQQMVAVTFAPAQQDVLDHREVWADLEIDRTSIENVVTVVTGSAATTTFTVRALPARMDPWVYESSITMLEVSGQWWVDWTSRVIHPALFDGRTLDRVDEIPQRGRISDHRGGALRAQRDAQEIGVVPGRLEDVDAVLFQLAEALDVDPDDVRADIEAPGVQPDWFIPVATLEQVDFDAVWPDLKPIPGVVFRTIDDRVSTDPNLAIHVLGTVGEITAEQLQAWGEPYKTGDIVGRSGLELAFEQELRGQPAAEIMLHEANGGLLSVLHQSGDTVPFEVRTTLDIDVQRAAEAAIDTATLPAGLVVIDVETGEVRAIASRPIDGFNRALGGLYPPGSTFKTITATAALAGGSTPTTVVACPTTINAGGFQIVNFGGSSLGNISLEVAYARSCNTAFARVGLDAGTDAMISAAELFGFNETYSVGLDTAGGRFPTPGDDAELASASIGQGRVQASPLHMASVAAAAADGVWHQPVLVLEPALEITADSRSLPADTVADLGQMMVAVVENGTGTAAAVPGQVVAGKTGSAEFGNEDPPQTHAWFIGYSEGLAIAVVVEAGGGGGSVAAPIAGAFFAELAGT